LDIDTHGERPVPLNQKRRMTAPWLENLVSHGSAISAANAGKVRRPCLDIYGSMPFGGSASRLRLKWAGCL